MTNASATAKCTALGGYLVSYGDAAEQLQVENYFSVGPPSWLIEIVPLAAT
jgi:hypothetical protein